MLKKILLVLLLSSSGCGDDSVNGAVDNGDPKEKPEPPASVADCVQCIVLSEQSTSRVAIADVKSQAIIWEWNPATEVRPEHVNWFSNMSDAKPVYGSRYILATASGGGVALVRIADHKTMFYAYAGGNTHSAEIFPDGNIISASSTGNFMTLFKTDTLHFPDGIIAKNIPLEFGHNVVWDHERQRLWTASMDKMKVFEYNFSCDNPDINLVESIDLPGTKAHDLFPVHGETALWLTNTTNIYRFNPATKTTTQADVIQPNIKSVSSAAGLPTIIIRPKEEWWTDEVIDANGNTVFYKAGLRIYKARWLVNNTFSYGTGSTVTVCSN